MPFVFSLLFGFTASLIFAWLVYWTDRYEKEPGWLIGGVFVWGAIFAAGGAYLINTLFGIGIYLFTGSEIASDLTTGSLVAPVIEEGLKGFAVLVVFLVFHEEFDSILDGIIYAAITALGFAATENVFYIFQKGYLEAGIQGFIGLAFIRIVLVGWQHPFYTSFTGIGLAVSRLSRSTWQRWLAPLLGFGLAVFTHSFHNTLAEILPGAQVLVIGSFFDWTGWFFMLLFVLWAIRREQGYLVKYLVDEVSNGTIQPAQYTIACSATSQSMSRLSALFTGRYRITRRFFQVCGELAHKKHQFARLGNEKNNIVIIENLRNELSRLSGLVTT